MYRKPSCWTVLLFLALLACTAHSQDGTDAANKVNQALIDQIAKEYQTDKVLSADGEINFNVLNFADALEMTRTELDGQSVSDDDYWAQVDDAVKKAIAKSPSVTAVKTKMGEFFGNQITFLRTLGKSNNDALVLLVAGVRKVKDLNYEWKKRLGGKITTATGGGAATGGATAAQSVPNWYTAMTEHKKKHWEYRAKKLAWRRAVHGY